MRVEGMKCEKCEKRVEGALGDLAGITSVTADRAAGTVEVTYDSNLVTVDAMHNVVESLGYAVVA